MSFQRSYQCNSCQDVCISDVRHSFMSTSKDLINVRRYLWLSMSVDIPTGDECKCPSRRWCLHSSPLALKILLDLKILSMSVDTCIRHLREGDECKCSQFKFSWVDFAQSAGKMPKKERKNKMELRRGTSGWVMTTHVTHTHNVCVSDHVDALFQEKIFWCI